MNTEIANELVTLLVKLVVLGCTGAFTGVVYPWLKNQSCYWLIKRAVQAAEKLGAVGAISKEKKKDWAISTLASWGVEVDDSTKVMIEAAVAELDAAGSKIAKQIADDDA
jgi:hypothetical protein